MSPFFLVQCSVPFISARSFLQWEKAPILCKNPPAYREEAEEELDGHRHRNAGHVSEAADAARARARRQAGDPREGPRHLADLDLGAARRRGACARLRAGRAGPEAR